MNEYAECGHPKQCLRLEDGDTYCGWCEDIKRLREQNHSLREQLLKTAFVVEGGESHFDGEEIGLLEIRGGTVHLFAKQCNQVAIHKTNSAHHKSMSPLGQVTADVLLDKDTCDLIQDILLA